MKRLLIVLIFCACASAQNYVKKTVCTAVGCDYPATFLGLFNAVNDSVTYQTSTACVPYIIEVQAGILINFTSGIHFPAKTCNQFIEIRSSAGSHFIPGKRYDPSVDNTFAAVFSSSGSGTMIDTPALTRYWRLRNVLMTTSAVTSGPIASYPITAASWSGGASLLTIPTKPTTVSGTWAINGVPASGGACTGTCAGYNNGNVTPGFENATQIAYGSADPGGSCTGSCGTATVLYNNSIPGWIQWGPADFDTAIYPDHLEIIQSAVMGSGQGELQVGMTVGADYIRVIDSYFSGIAKTGDSQAISSSGSETEIRNTYLSAVSESLGGGGGIVSAGIVPSFQYNYGNYFIKEPWMNYVIGTGTPTQPCYKDSIFHDATANRDYLCNTTTVSGPTGSWTIQTNLTNYASRPFPYQWPKNHEEHKTGKALRTKGTWYGMIPAQSSQNGLGIVANVVSQPFESLTCTAIPNLPQPCQNVPQVWTTLGDLAIINNRFDTGLGPFAMGYAVYSECQSDQINNGTSTWTVVGNGTATITTTGSAPVPFPAGYSSWPNGNVNLSSMILSGGSLGGGTVIGVNSTAVGGLSMVMAATVPTGTYLMTLPCVFNGHHDIDFSNNLITNLSDERTYCPTFSGSCTVASACGNACGTQGHMFFDGSQHDVLMEHNTQTTSKYSAVSGLTLNIGGNLSQSSDYSGQWTVRNNIGANGVHGFLSGPSDGCGFYFMLNNSLGGTLDLRNNILTKDLPTGQTWETFATGTVTPACATTSIWPTNHAGNQSWLWDLTTGAGHGVLDATTFKVTNPTYQAWGSDGRDPGANVDLVNASTAGTIAGNPNPFLDVLIRSTVLTPNGHGVTIQATAPDTGSCTWELSTDPNLYASPVAVSSQSRIGRNVVAVWNDGTLAGSTVYYARMTCGSYPGMETNINGSRAMIITAPGGSPPPLTITNNPLPNGTVGISYSAINTGSGGSAPYTYAVSAGSLPSGLSLNTTTGAISGTPTTPVVALPVTVTVTDSVLATASTSGLTITIVAAPTVHSFFTGTRTGTFK